MDGKKFKLSVILFTYLHRFLRIWPAYIFAIGIFWLYSPFWGSGPLWFIYQKTAKKCDDRYYYKQSWAKLQLILNQFNLCYTNKERTTLTYLARSLLQLRLSEKLRPATFTAFQKFIKIKFQFLDVL